MGKLYQEHNVLVWQEERLKVWLTALGENAIRVQANITGKPLDLVQALIAPQAGPAAISVGEGSASIENGQLRAEIRTDGKIKFTHSRTGAVLLEQPEPYYYKPANLGFKHRDGELYQVSTLFQAQSGERFYGLGQHQHGLLDQKGVVLDLQQRNTEISIPFVVSNRKYGFLWNNPGIGRVELGSNHTRWIALATRQLDYVVFSGSDYVDIMRGYADATGHPALLPDWATSFWQCKLRYRTQDELLGVAREYKRRGLPLSVIVADFFHWSHMGDWKFDPKCWPNPAAMAQELKEMGVKLMVSIWPTVSPISENFKHMKDNGLLIHNERGTDAQQVFLDHDINGPAYFAYYDATHPETRQFVFQTAKKNYYDNGVKLWWLDNDEPDIQPWDPENHRFYLGNGMEVANIYPLQNQMGFEEGMQSIGDMDYLSLSRSGWAGSQRFQSVIWSGDIASTFDALGNQIRAGLNMAMSGITWWTTDIGGFHGGDIQTDVFKELIVRWFEYAVFCPITRLHGYRQPGGIMIETGADNEVWSFGEEVYAVLANLLKLRENLRPYIREQAQITHERGVALMRPLFVDFPADARCEAVEDQYMFGSELLVAPVVQQGATGRSVYFPAGAEWFDAWNGERHTGGSEAVVSAPLDRIPVFLKNSPNLGKLFTV
jgi:alpha-D-xyloside xylohydrolase